MKSLQSSSHDGSVVDRSLVPFEHHFGYREESSILIESLSRRSTHSSCQPPQRHLSMCRNIITSIQRQASRLARSAPIRQPIDCQDVAVSLGLLAIFRKGPVYPVGEGKLRRIVCGALPQSGDEISVKSWLLLNRHNSCGGHSTIGAVRQASLNALFLGPDPCKAKTFRIRKADNSRWRR